MTDLTLPDSPKVFPDKPVRWMNYYRNCALLLLVILSLCSLVLFCIAGPDRVPMLLWGLVCASLLYVMNGTRYWRLFKDLVILEAVNELTWTKRSVMRDLLLYGIVFVIGFVTLTLLGIIPGKEMIFSPAFYAGFSVMTWYHYIMVSVFERRNHRTIITDGPMLYLSGKPDE